MGLSQKKALKDALYVRDVFLKNDIKYMITGSFAVAAYLGAGSSSDIDFVISTDDFEKASTLLKVEPKLKKNSVGYFYSMDYKKIEVSTFSAIQNMLGLHPFLFEKEFGNSGLLSVNGTYFRFSSLEYIILQKLLLNRGIKDTGAIKKLLKNKKVNKYKILIQSFLLRITYRYFKYVF